MLTPGAGLVRATEGAVFGGGGNAYVTLSLGRSEASAAYSLDSICLKLAPVDACMTRQP